MLVRYEDRCLEAASRRTFDGNGPDMSRDQKPIPPGQMLTDEFLKPLGMSI